MEDEEDDDLDITETTQGQPAQPTNAPTTEPTAPVAAAAEPKGGQEEGVQQVKHSDLKRIKQKNRDRGRREALAELDVQAKVLGYSSHAEMLKDLQRLKGLNQAPPIAAAQPAEPPQPKEEPTMATTKTPKDEKQAQRDAAERQRQADERAKERKQWRASERARKEMQAQLDAKDAEMALREELYRAGVTDVDYALRLLTRSLEGKTEEEIASFDRSKFYEGLKADRPYLFGEKVVPATTGTSGVKQDGAAPAAPAPGAVAADAAASQQFDARKAKPQEVQDRLRALGLNPHM